MLDCNYGDMQILRGKNKIEGIPERKAACSVRRQLWIARMLFIANIGFQARMLAG